MACVENKFNTILRLDEYMMKFNRTLFLVNLLIVRKDRCIVRTNDDRHASSLVKISQYILLKWRAAIQLYISELIVH